MGVPQWIKDWKLDFGFIHIGRSARPSPSPRPAALPTEPKPRAMRRIELACETIDSGGDDQDAADKVEIERCKSAGYSLAIGAALRRARRIERKRWSAIMNSDEAVGRFSMARELALAEMPANRALDILRRTPIRSRLAERMEGVIPRGLAGCPRLDPGEDVIAASWSRAMAEFAPARAGKP